MFKITAEEKKFTLRRRLKLLASEKKFWKKQYSGDLPHWMESDEPSKLANRFIEELKKVKNKNARVLEIGIGNGRDSNYFHECGCRVNGIDIAKRPVKYAIKKYPKVKFEQMDAEKLRFKDKLFDGVYTLSVLHSTDPHKSFKQVNRVLKDKGLFLCFMYLKTVDEKGKVIDNHAKLSDITKAIEDNNFNLDDLYVNKQDDKIDDEHNEPHTHEVLVIVLKKGY